MFAGSRAKVPGDLEAVETIRAAESDIEHDDVGHEEIREGDRLVPVARELGAHALRGRQKLVGEEGVRASSSTNKTVIAEDEHAVTDPPEAAMRFLGSFGDRDGRGWSTRIARRAGFAVGKITAFPLASLKWNSRRRHHR